MKFKNPAFLLLFIPLLWAAFRAYSNMLAGKYAQKISVPWKGQWNFSARALVMPPRFWPFLASLIAGALLIFALARPQTSYQKVKKSVEGIDIMLVLDLSASMRIEDFRDQNRLEVAKPIIHDFVMGRVSDRVSFETFSGEAVTLVPPTLDHALLLQALQNVDIGDLKDGTAIGDALATAVGRLKESTAKSRVIILLTDGDSNVGAVDPLTAGELAKGYGIRVYSIAIGKEGRVAMPFIQRDIFGRQVKTYQYYDSSINPELLKKISSMTGAKFYRVQDDENTLRNVFKEIDKLEKQKIETNEQVKYDEKFMSFVQIAFFMLILGFLARNWWVRVYP